MKNYEELMKTNTIKRGEAILKKDKIESILVPLLISYSKMTGIDVSQTIEEKGTDMAKTLYANFLKRKENKK